MAEISTLIYPPTPFLLPILGEERGLFGSGAGVQNQGTMPLLQYIEMRSTPETDLAPYVSVPPLAGMLGTRFPARSSCPSSLPGLGDGRGLRIPSER
ncbi:MAG: hypothetical protein E6R14_05585 [Thermomicrobiales bacterium]|nr:MAG: hypothetical protein E6R14_05585 [Thermomicrobiales bacterium]